MTTSDRSDDGRSGGRPRLAIIVTEAITADYLLRGQLGALARSGFEVTLITSPNQELDRIAQREAIKDADRTPSAIMIAAMRKNQEGFHEFAKRLSKQNLQYFKTQHLSQQKELFYSQESQQSIHKQTEIEQADELSFEAYLQRYFAQSL